MNLALLSQSASLAEHLHDLLAGSEHALRVQTDLPACQAELAAAPPDVLLVATADGAEVCGAVGARPDAPRVLLLSPDAADSEGAQDAGALFLQVPCSGTELLTALQVATRRQPLVLLVDDSSLIHKHTVPILVEAGYEVAAAHDGAEGLRRAEELRPDLVISDIEMPKLDGYGLCKALKARFPTTPVAICSALGEAQDVERGFDAGADDYLVKPAQPEELLSRVQLLLRRRAGRPARERLLVVDDSPAIRHLVSESLRRQGFSVLTAPDGEAGLHSARAERPAMIITDYDMPRMTGFEMVHALKQDPATRTIPVMMLTARNTRRDQAQMRAIGLTSYLVKPFAVDKCVAMVERVLAEKRLRAYKTASQLYISEATVKAAEQAAQSDDLFAVRATEKVAAVLFSDISGFTQLSAQRGPREVVDLLNEFFDVLCPVIRQEGGDIDKFIGDAIMAVFEDSSAHPDPAPLRAVRAALRMQEALRKWRAKSGHDLHMRIGVNTGPLVRGDIGSRHVRRDYTVIGDAVNRAQRFESNAPVGGVLIGESTYLAVRERIRCEPRPGIRLKGVPEAVTGYLALAEEPGP